MESLQIDSVNIGLPGAGPRALQHTEALAREIAADRQRLEPLLRAALQPLRSKLPEELKAVGALALLDDPPGACEAVCRLVPMLGARLFSSKQSPG